MNRGLAIRYTVYSVGGLGVSGMALPWALPLVWLSFAWLWLAMGYAGVGPRVWGKNGQPFSIWLVWPARQLIHAAHRHRRGDDESPVEFASGLWFGGRLSPLQASRWLPAGVAVLDVAPEYGADWGRCQPAYLALDMLEGTSASALDLVISELFIELHRGQGVYVHGALGNARAALVAATWLMRQYPRLTVEQVQAMLVALKPGVHFNAGQTLVLQQVRLLQQDTRRAGR